MANLGPATVKMTEAYHAPNPAEGGTSIWVWLLVLGGVGYFIATPTGRQDVSTFLSGVTSKLSGGATTSGG